VAVVGGVFASGSVKKIAIYALPHIFSKPFPLNFGHIFVKVNMNTWNG